ncbi:MAG TPA: hypothetical protein VMW12_05385 [Candidatus Dormibacteraeota bacterium]|nr:hypothetical protein [Candidatus Dormibacteraeota bacterium]
MATLFLLAACGGGGGSGSGSGSTGTPTQVVPVQTPQPNPAAILAQVNGPTGPETLALDSVVFSCGCQPDAGQTALAGQTSTDANGMIALPSSSSGIPSGTYSLVGGRNYLIVTSGFNTESWTMEHVGTVPANNLTLSAGPGAGTDPAQAAAALYVFRFSDATPPANLAYDDWNFSTIASWVARMRSGPVSAAESTLLTDISASQAAGKSLYPMAPPWNRNLPTNPNAGTINTDLANVQQSAATEPSLPTPCPSGGCTGTPTP